MRSIYSNLEWIDPASEKMFFTYANTVATIDFAKKYRGHGWMGLKFQTDATQDYSEILIHVRFNC